ncbi:type II toxin-antitoxin system HipA family toxin [Methylobacterium frigidaeris]|uniref:Phosphatidylinositol kinase n=1 Tax=Methylobacterium frigidaeris TaxID=2038277 RepID=A0AA37HI71_9HYPH|nr:type II toxin-antitoxin system HipA family toxin [Methylobacterium frigidaeris]PIK71980.1 phosphatidylinositol kinase [Methylobacterium frigidaeris]GJD66440.1 hypothetical protein MPEAHAMD_6638 [Methylobacterium frigidaeris]
MWQTSRSGRIDRLVVFRWHVDAYVPAGELTVEGAGTTRMSRFRYARSYFALDGAQPIDPLGLPLMRKSYPAVPEEVPLAFHDAGPDGWGKEVLRRAFPRSVISMPEYLALGGTSRTGNLAFGPTPEAGPQPWMPAEEPLVELPRESDDLETLMEAAAAVDAGTGTRHHFALLFRKSADVGGARPKARLRHDGRQWIAKLPTVMDRFDDPRVEAACLDVAAAAGLPVPEHKIVAAGGRAALLVERFDRAPEPDGRPYGYLSAATLLEQPSTRYGTDKTYVDIAEAARRIGVAGAATQVFARLLLNAYLHNTDDHLRNHAFIDRGGGWDLSPVFDIVPHPDVRRHVCAPAKGIGPAWDANAAFRAHEALKIGTADAMAIRDRIVAAAKRLPEFMDAREVTQTDREFLRDTFPEAIGFNP